MLCLKAAAQGGRAQRARDVREMHLAFLHTRGQRRTQTGAAHIKPLARTIKQAVGPRQSARHVAQPLVTARKALAERLGHPCLLPIKQGYEFMAHRHRKLGCRRRRGRALVRDIVDQRGIGFMPHRRNQRNLGCCGCPSDDLFVEPP